MEQPAAISPEIYTLGMLRKYSDVQDCCWGQEEIPAWTEVVPMEKGSLEHDLYYLLYMLMLPFP